MKTGVLQVNTSWFKRVLSLRTYVIGVKICSTISVNGRLVVYVLSVYLAHPFLWTLLTVHSVMQGSTSNAAQTLLLSLLATSIALQMSSKLYVGTSPQNSV